MMIDETFPFSPRNGHNYGHSFHYMNPNFDPSDLDSAVTYERSDILDFKSRGSNEENMKIISNLDIILRTRVLVALVRRVRNIAVTSMPKPQCLLPTTQDLCQRLLVCGGHCAMGNVKGKGSNPLRRYRLLKSRANFTPTIIVRANKKILI